MTGLERLRNVANAMRGYAVRGGGPLALELMGIADLIERETERDPEDDVSMSAYDLLPECDRKAISLALDCGGVEEIKKRLMPAGMEWPRFENGEPVRFGDVVSDGDETGRVYYVTFDTVNPVIIGFTDETPDQDPGTWLEVSVNDGERVKRPAPKVLDAEGVEIRVGDVLYSIETGDSVTVGSIEPGNPWFATTDGTLQHCAKLTHRAPVLAADGKRILKGDVLYDRAGNRFEVLKNPENDQSVIANFTDEDGKAHRTFTKALEFTHDEPVLAADGLALRDGETVWGVDSGTRYTVEKITDELIPIKCRSEMGSTVSLCPSQLTHQRPDSWERLEEDAGKNPFDYCKDVGHRLDTCENSEACKARDLVRRARKLAGVS